MPRFDATGPWGMGAGTGWGWGPCGGGRAWRRGQGRGFGRFRGFPLFGPGAPQDLTKKEEMEILGEEEKALEEELKALKEGIAKLKKKK